MFDHLFIDSNISIVSFLCPTRCSWKLLMNFVDCVVVVVIDELLLLLLLLLLL